MDYNLKINDLLKRYNLYEKEVNWTERKNEIINRNIKNVIDKFNKDPRVGIWGGGSHTVKLLETENVKNLNIVGIYDKSESQKNKRIKEYRIKGLTDISKDRIDVIIISSYEFKENIKVDIKEFHPNLEYIDLYENENTFFHTDMFAYEWVHRYSNCKYLLDKYNKNKNEENLKKIIVNYLSLKDFVSAKVFIKEYIFNKYRNHSMLNDFLVELEFLINEMKAKITCSTNKNILLLATDALRSKDMLDNNSTIHMPYVKSLFEKSIVFKNAFSPSEGTTESYRSIFCGKRLFEEDTFKVEKLDERKSDLLSYLLSEGYKLYNYFPLRIRDEKIFKDVGELKKFKPMTLLMWDYLCKMAEEIKEDKFSFINLMESHMAFISGYSDQVDKENNDGLSLNVNTNDPEYIEYLKAIRYIDYQLRFYLSILSDKDMVIIMSDHGNKIKHEYGEGTPNIWGDNEIHVPVVIRCNKQRIINELFSTKDLGTVIVDILNKNEIKIPKSDYIVVERTPIYNPIYRMAFISWGMVNRLQALRMIRTQNEKYIKYENGVEEYYLIEDETKNLINDKRYLQRVEYFRNLKENEEFPEFQS